MTPVGSVVPDKTCLRELCGLSALWVSAVWSSTMLVQKLDLLGSLGAIMHGKVESRCNIREGIRAKPKYQCIHP